MNNKMFAIILLFVSVSFADFLSVDIVEKEEPPPIFVYGINYTARVFAGGVDNFGGLNVRYRINKSFATGIKGEIDFSRSGFLAGAFLHYLLQRELYKELSESFVHLGVDYIKINNTKSPIFSVGYGRDMLPWKKSPFGFRVLGRIEYAPVKNIFSRENKGIFGIKSTTLANTDFAIEAGVFIVF